MATGNDRNSNVIRAYLLAISMLGLGLAGVVVIAAQASRSGGPAPAQTSAKASGQTLTRAAMGPGRAAPRPTAVDAAVPRTRPTATPDAAVARAADAGAPRRPATPPDAAVVATAPPKHAGGAPTLVVQFPARSTRPLRGARADIRKLVSAHGYKNVRYKLTAYAAEQRRPKNNRALARRRCYRVTRLIRGRGVSRRWIDCLPPVFRAAEGKATDADRAPAWRRVEIRVEKP
jgi:hypothetical protein